MASVWDEIRTKASGIMGRSVSRRRFAVGGAAAVGAGVVATALSSCSSDDQDSSGTGEPQVVTDDSQIVGVLDGDYDEDDNQLEAASTWTLPLGTVLFHGGGSWAAAMLTPESSLSVNTLGVLSLETGGLSTIVSTPTQGSAYDFYDVRCSDDLFAWVEINYSDRSWVLVGQALSGGALSGDPVQLDSGDKNWDPPRFTVADSRAIWLKMPNSTGASSGEDSRCYAWSIGDDDGTVVWTSTGRFATPPRVSDGSLTITPRVRNDEGVYYGMTALQISGDGFSKIDQLVLPRGVAPFEAVYMNGNFVFSIEASYSDVGSLGNMGTFIGGAGGPYIYVRREPLAWVAGNGTRYLIKTQASHFVIDTAAQTYATLRAPDRCVDYGDWPASEGTCSRYLSYATVRDSQGIPESVTARVFSL